MPVPPVLLSDLMASKGQLAGLFPDAKVARELLGRGEFLGWFLGVALRLGTNPHLWRFEPDEVVGEAKRLNVKGAPGSLESFGMLLAQLDRGFLLGGPGGRRCGPTGPRGGGGEWVGIGPGSSWA